MITSPMPGAALGVRPGFSGNASVAPVRPPSLRQWQPVERPRFGSDWNIPGCKGSRFITNNRYKPNPQWAGAVEDLARAVGKDLKEGRITAAQPLIDRIIGDYQQTIGEKNAEYWGTPRDYIEAIPADSFRASRARSLRLHTRQGERLNKQDIPCGKFIYTNDNARRGSKLEKRSWKEQACGPEEKVVRYAVEIEGKKVQLLQLQPMGFDGETHLCWVFPQPQPEVQAHIARLTEEAMALKDAPKTQETLDQAVRRVATIHWLFSLSMPYVRGSAGTADILSKVIFDQLGIETGNWRDDLSPDIEAFCTPNLRDYIGDYSSFFTRRPAFATGKQLNEVA